MKCLLFALVFIRLMWSINLFALPQGLEEKYMYLRIHVLVDVENLIADSLRTDSNIEKAKIYKEWVAKDKYHRTNEKAREIYDDCTLVDQRLMPDDFLETIYEILRPMQQNGT